MKTQVQSTPAPFRKRYGFTLVELLVVIVIIAVLVALSIGGIFKYRKAADKTAAIANMRGLQTANALYAADNNGSFVNAYSFDGDEKLSGAWNTNLEFVRIFTGNADLKGTWTMEGIPQSALDPVVVRAKKHRWDQLDASYGYNQEHMPPGWGQKDTTTTYKLSTLTDPARTFAFISCTDWNAKFSGRYLWKGAQAVEGKTPDGKIAFRHEGKAAVVYFDGRVTMLSEADMRKIDQGGISNSARNNIFWDGIIGDNK